MMDRKATSEKKTIRKSNNMHMLQHNKREGDYMVEPTSKDACRKVSPTYCAVLMQLRVEYSSCLNIEVLSVQVYRVRRGFTNGL